MDKDSKFTRDEEGYVAVRVVSGTEALPAADKDYMFARDTNGNIAVRVVGAGGDEHNMGYFATPAALAEAYPTGEAGDYAVVGSTDTIWIWDADESEWVDSDRKGQVTSVNNETGAVSLDINDVAPTQTDKSGYVLGTDGFVAGWVKPEIVQRSTLPQASEEEVGKIYQYVGTTDANHTNGYFYKCVSDGQNPATYSWENIEVQEVEALPSQTGNNGKYLKTNGTSTSWGNALENTASGTNGLVIQNRGARNFTGSGCTVLNVEAGVNVSSFGFFLTGVRITSNYNLPGNMSVGINTIATGSNAVAIANGSASGEYAIAINAMNGGATRPFAIAMGCNCTASADYAIQIGYSRYSSTGINSDANTFKVSNYNGNFEIMSADGTVPADRLIHAINKYSTMPTASANNLGWIVQFTGTTDSTYTHGYIYECVSDGQNPATYSWEAVEVQASSGGLPSQTGQSGKFLTTDGTDASWSDKPFIQKDPDKRGVCISSYVQSFTTQSNSANIAVIGSASYSNINLGKNSIAIAGQIADTNTPTGVWGVFIGSFGEATGKGSVALGSGARATADGAIQISGKCQSTLGLNTAINSDANTFKVANGNGNYEMMSADGTIPTDRLTKVNTTITLAAADWSSNSQTVNVTGMTATGVVIVSPDPTDQADYTAAGIICSAQAAGTLTFTCDSTPTNDIDVVVIML